MYQLIKRAEEVEQAAASAMPAMTKIKVDKRNNKEIEALRSAMASGSGADVLKDMDVYKANRPEDSFMMTNEEGTPDLVNINKDYAPINSHEYGHAIDFNKPLTKYRNIAPLFINPTLMPVSTLYNEYRANKDSWDAINKVYSDDPELLQNFSDLRDELLTPAYRTYIHSLVPKIIGGTIGTAAGFAIPMNSWKGRYVSQYIGGAAGTAGGTAMSDVMGFRDRHRKAMEELQYKLHNDADIKRRLALLNRQIVRHARKNNYYEQPAVTN